MNSKKLLLLDAIFWASQAAHEPSQYPYAYIDTINDFMDDWQMDGEDVWSGSDETLCWYALLLREVV